MAQFTASNAVDPAGETEFEGLARLQSLWNRRVTAGKEELAQMRPGAGPDEVDADPNKSAVLAVADARAALLASPFRDLSVARNTAALWGKRVVQCAVTSSVAFALSDLGEMWAWGGTDHWWHKFEAESVWHSEVGVVWVGGVVVVWPRDEDGARRRRCRCRRCSRCRTHRAVHHAQPSYT